MIDCSRWWTRGCPAGVRNTQWTTANDLDDLGEAITTAIERTVPATFVSVSQPIEDRVNQLLAGSRADVVIKMFGEDLSRAFS